MNGRTDVRDAFTETFFGPRSVGRFPFSFVDIGSRSAVDAAAAVMEELCTADRAHARHGGVGVAVRGVSRGRRRARHRDRRVGRSGRAPRCARVSRTPSPPTPRGAPASSPTWTRPRPSPTGWACPYDAGAPMERTDEPAPLDLYERYLQQRRLAVPAAAGSWGVMLLFGLAGFLALAFRRPRVPPACSPSPGRSSVALPWLALGLLLVGHLPSLRVRDRGPVPVVFVGRRRRVHARGSPRGGGSSSRWPLRGGAHPGAPRPSRPRSAGRRP